MATWLALAAFFAIVGLPIYLMWGMPRAHRPARMDPGEEVVVPDNSIPTPPFTDASHESSAGGDGGTP